MPIPSVPLWYQPPKPKTTTQTQPKPWWQQAAQTVGNLFAPHAPAYGGSYNPTVTNPQTPSWLQHAPAYGGSYNPTVQQNPAVYPTGSFLSGSGQNLAQYNANQQNPAIYPTNTFLSGSGAVNTGVPVFPVLPSLEEGAGSGGGGYGTAWHRRRGRGGGGRGYQPRPAYQPVSQDYMPSTARVNWSI